MRQHYSRGGPVLHHGLVPSAIHAIKWSEHHEAPLRTDRSAGSYNAGLGPDNELQGGIASMPEQQAGASIGVQDCVRGTAADGGDWDFLEELEAIIGGLWRCLNGLYGFIMCCSCLYRAEAAAQSKR